MPSFNNLDLIVKDVPAAAAFFRDVVGLKLNVNDDRFAELDSGVVKIMLSPDALIPVKPAAGVIVHFEVNDVSAAVEHARSQGATILLELMRTDWGTETALIAGPEEIVVAFDAVVEG